MIWTQWLFIAIVLAIVVLVGIVVYRNPERFISKIYTNPLVVILIGALAVIVFAWFAGEHTALEKAAFGLGSLLAVRYLALAAGFAEMFSPKPGAVVTRLDVNMLVSVLAALAILAGMLNFIGVAEFADAAIESIAGAIGAGFLTVIDVYRNKDRNGE